MDQLDTLDLNVIAWFEVRLWLYYNTYSNISNGVLKLSQNTIRNKISGRVDWENLSY